MIVIGFLIFGQKVNKTKNINQYFTMKYFLNTSNKKTNKVKTF